MKKNKSCHPGSMSYSKYLYGNELFNYFKEMMSQVNKKLLKRKKRQLKTNAMPSGNTIFQNDVLLAHFKSLGLQYY